MRVEDMRSKAELKTEDLELAVFAGLLAQLTGSNLPMRTALPLAASHLSFHFAKLASAIVDDINNRVSVSEALRNNTDNDPSYRLLAFLIEVGEAGTQMGVALSGYQNRIHSDSIISKLNLAEDFVECLRLFCVMLDSDMKEQASIGLLATYFSGDLKENLLFLERSLKADIPLAVACDSASAGDFSNRFIVSFVKCGETTGDLSGSLKRLFC